MLLICRALFLVTSLFTSIKPDIYTDTQIVTHTVVFIDFLSGSKK